MQPERRSTQPELRDVFKVSQWKWNVDDSEPWWRRAFFRYIFLPFIDFSFGAMKVPTPKEVTVESDEHGNVRRTYSWFEDEGIFDDEERAEAGCLAEHWGYKRMPHNRLMPSESAQYSGTIFPRKKNPRKWAKPTLSLVIKDRQEDQEMDRQFKECLAKLNEELDRR